MDPFHLCIALGPLGVYLLLMGIINLMPRPFLTNGARDTAALCIAISGFVVAGPMELFLPDVANVRLGPFVWFLLLGLYALPGDPVDPGDASPPGYLQHQPGAIAAGAGRVGGGAGPGSPVGTRHAVDAQAARAPLRGNAGGHAHVQLVAMGMSQSHLGWRRLERQLAASLAGMRRPRPTRTASVFSGSPCCCSVS